MTRAAVFLKEAAVLVLTPQWARVQYPVTAPPQLPGKDVPQVRPLSRLQAKCTDKTKTFGAVYKKYNMRRFR